MDSLGWLVLASSSSFLYGLSHIFARLSLVHVHPVGVAGIFTLVNLVIAAPIGFTTVAFEAYRWQAIVGFVVMGLFGFGGLRVLMAIGIHFLGASRNAPISGIYPLFTTLGGSLLFQEQPGLGVWVGIVLIVCGVMWLSQEGDEGTTWDRKYIALPILQALFRSIGALSQKLGLIYMNAPMFAIAIGGISGGCCILIYGWFCRKDENVCRFNTVGVLFGVLLGLTNTAALYLFTVALASSDVSLVVPVISTSPLFTLLLAKLFLRNLENVGREALYGGIVIVVGTVLITFSAGR